MGRKVKTSVTLDEDLLRWLDKEIQTRRFASRTHAIEYAIIQPNANVALPVPLFEILMVFKVRTPPSFQKNQSSFTGIGTGVKYYHVIQQPRIFCAVYCD